MRSKRAAYFDDLFRKLVQTFVRKSHIIHSYDVGKLNHEGLTTNRYAAGAVYGTRGIVWGKRRFGCGFGDGNTKQEALAKAMMEALERFYAGEVFTDKVSTFKALRDTAHAPYEFWTLNSGSYGFESYRSFNESKKYSWVRGTKMSDGSPRYVLAEQVFYPTSKQQLGHRPLTQASSNGAAAHSTVDGATMSALTELIERDAIALAWYGGKPIRRLSESSAPSSLRVVCRHWRRRGVRVIFYDLTVDSIPVVLCVFLSSTSYPYFVCGGAATLTYSSAMNRAFNEAQFGYLALKLSPRKRVSAKEISSPADHAAYYAEKGHSRAIFRRLHITNSKNRRRGKKIRFTRLVQMFDPVSVVIHKSGPLAVVRVLSSKLTPLGFGSNNDMVNKKRFRDLNLVYRPTKTPHFFP